MDDSGESIVVRIDRRTRQAMTRMFVFLMVALVSAAVVSQMLREPRPLIVALGMALAAIAFGAMGILCTARSKVVLHRDYVEVTWYPWPTRRVVNADIAGRYFNPVGFRTPAYHVLVTRSGQRVKFPPYLQASQELRAWLRDIPLLSTHRSSAH